MTLIIHVIIYITHERGRTTKNYVFTLESNVYLLLITQL